MATDTDFNAIEKGIFAKLNVAGVTALVPAARHWNMLVPPSSTYPVVVVQFMDSDDAARGMGFDAESAAYLVKAIASGDPTVAAAGEVAAAIDTALHGATLTATGFTVYRCSRVRRVRYMEYDSQRVPYVHAGAVYRIWMHR